MMRSPSITWVLSKWKKRPSSAGYHAIQRPPSPPTSRASDLRGSGLLPSYGNDLMPFRSISMKKSTNSVLPVLVGKDGRDCKVFLVERHILDHWLFQELVRKSSATSPWLERCLDETKETEMWFVTGAKKSNSVTPIFLDCDAILFEFFLWLVENDDPTLRGLNLADLMEFYGAEA